MIPPDYTRDLTVANEETTPCAFHADRVATALLEQDAVKIPVCLPCWLLRNPQGPTVKPDALWELYQKGAIDRAEYDELMARNVRRDRERR